MRSLVLLLVLAVVAAYALGGTKDLHGCIPSAGFQWCEALGKCHRPWETACRVPDRKVCDLAAGESWCPTTGRCLQLALEACPTTVSQRRD